MRVIPVMDVLGGQAVHAVGGIRHEYRPLSLGELEQACPIAVAHTLGEHYRMSEWYVADLDGIVHRRWNRELVSRLVAEGFSLRVDWGIAEPEDLFEIGPDLLQATRCILASEVLRDRSVFDSLTGMLDPSQLIFSIDLVDGVLQAPPGAWCSAPLEEIVGHVVSRGVHELIVLDLAYVGCQRGPGTRELCTRLKRDFPELSLTTGGGIRTRDQLCELEQIGVDAVLLGSWLHDRAFPAEWLGENQEWRGMPVSAVGGTRSKISG